MSLKIGDRILETSTSTGTGTFALAGAVTGYRRFSAVLSNGDTVPYLIDGGATGEWELGIGTWSGNVLTRTTVVASSNANAAVSFSSGTKKVGCLPIAGGPPIMTAIVAPTALPAANSVVIQNIPQVYTELLLMVEGASADTATRAVQVQASVDNGSSYPATSVFGNVIRGSTPGDLFGGSSIVAPDTVSAAQTTGFMARLAFYANGPWTKVDVAGFQGTSSFTHNLIYSQTAGINALRIQLNSTGNFDAGTYSLWGIR